MDQRRDNRNNSRRDGRARAAAKHIAAMEERFGKEIAASVAGVRLYDGMLKLAKVKADKIAAEGAAATAAFEELLADAGTVASEAAADVDVAAQPAVEQPEAPSAPAVTVVAQDATAAVLENGRGRALFCDTALLDFASFTNPGGGYERGAWAQEEALCADSFLYNVLATQKDFYGANRRRNINCNLYRNRGLVAPKVRFERDKVHAYADVIVVAAPNARRAREEYGVSRAQLEQAMRDRIRFVLAIADDLGHDKLILGAFGCGVFGWDAEQVAEMLRAELATGGHVATQVIIAVPQTRFDENLAKFEHVFSAFPDAPAESYAAAAANRAEAAAEQAAADAEDEDDNEDWRKYL